MAHRWKHPQPRTAFAVWTDKHLAKHLAVITPIIKQLPRKPTGVFGVGFADEARLIVLRHRAQIWRSTTIFLTSAIALLGESPLGQTFEQFMIVWQR